MSIGSYRSENGDVMDIAGTWGVVWDSAAYICQQFARCPRRCQHNTDFWDYCEEENKTDDGGKGEDCESEGDSPRQGKGELERLCQKFTGICHQTPNMLRSSWTFGSTWAGRLRPSLLARCERSFCFRYSVRALGLWQYGWYVVTRAWEISQAYEVVQGGGLKIVRNRTWLTQELRLRVWGQYCYSLK